MVSCAYIFFLDYDELSIASCELVSMTFSSVRYVVATKSLSCPLDFVYFVHV